MSLIEDAVEHVSVQSAVVGLFSLYVLWATYVWTDQYFRLQSLGGTRAPKLKYILPGGLDFMYKSVKALEARRNLEMWMGWFSEIGGYTAEATLLGNRVIFTADPENIKAVLATQFVDYGKGEQFHREWHDFLGDSIFATDGELWHKSRQLIRPMFIKDHISVLKCFEDHLETLFRAMANGGALKGADQPVDMSSAATDGKVFDICELVYRYTLDVTTDFLLGHSVGSLITPRQDFAEAFNEVQRIMSMISRTSPMNPFVPHKALKKGIKVMNEFINHYVELALQLSPEELDSKSKLDSDFTFLHELANFTRDRMVLRDQIVAILLAGRDTTASTLSWTLYELGRNPEVVARLRKEILSTLGPDRAPTYTNLKDMKYLQNILNEILRLYPSVPINMRIALKDTTLPRGGGPDGSHPLAVLKGAHIVYSTLVMQRRIDLYPPALDGSLKHPHRFCPDRWVDWRPKPWQYIPFNGGPRICIGQQFALTEIGYVLTRMFQRYDRVTSYMNGIDGGEPMLKCDIVLQPGQGVKVAFWQASK